MFLTWLSFLTLYILLVQFLPILFLEHFCKIKVFLLPACLVLHLSHFSLLITPERKKCAQYCSLENLTLQSEKHLEALFIFSSWPRKLVYFILNKVCFWLALYGLPKEFYIIFYFGTNMLLFNALGNQNHKKGILSIELLHLL